LKLFWRWPEGRHLFEKYRIAAYAASVVVRCNMDFNQAVLILWHRPTRKVFTSPDAIAAYVEFRPDLVICINSSGVMVGRESNSAMVAVVVIRGSLCCGGWLGGVGYDRSSRRMNLARRLHAGDRTMG
jgi:hypothetical protein